jgi:ferredoxin
MRVTIDHDRCEGHGSCTQAAPTIFSFDDVGELANAFADADIPDDLSPAAREAADVCPVAALRNE